MQATPEVAHLTMETFGVIHQLAGGDDALSFSTKIHMTQSRDTDWNATCYDYPDNPHSFTFLTFSIYFWHQNILVFID